MIYLYGLDYLILVVIGIATIYGGIKGVLTFIAAGLSVAAAFLLLPIVHPFALTFKFYGNTMLWKLILFLVLFILVNLTLQIVVHLLREILESLFIGWINHLFGALFMFLIACVAVYLISLLYHLLSATPYASISSKILRLFNEIFTAYIEIGVKR